MNFIRILKYFVPENQVNIYEKQKINAFLTVCLVGILLVTIDFFAQLFFPSKNFIITIFSIITLAIFLIFNLFLLKIKGIKLAGNILSAGMVIILAFFMNLFGDNISLMFKYLQSFYAALAFLALGLLFASRKVLIFNTIIIALSAVHVYIAAIEQSPEQLELYRTGLVNFIIVTFGIGLIVYFSIKFSDNALKTAAEDTMIKEIQNLELLASEEEIRANNEELRATTDALKDINDELMNAKQKAEESNRIKSAFLTNISHEIRTPMNGIIGFSRMLDDNDLSEANRKYYTEIIVKSSEQLLKIIDDTLEV
jgi:signal transduction histidine kinase